MTSLRGRTMARTLVGTVMLGVLAAPLVAAAPGTAASSSPMWRKMSAPNVFFPVYAGKSVKDLGTYSSRHRSTEVAAACGAAVRAAHPGVAKLETNAKWKGRVNLKVVSGTNGLVTSYGFLARTTVTTGQIIQSGQRIGYLAPNPRTDRCQLSFAVKRAGTPQNPSSWLNSYVGKTPPVGNLFDAPGIRMASFNVLGASHTTSSSRYATYSSRMTKTVAMFRSRSYDVVGVQEFQPAQKAQFLRQTAGAWGVYNWVGPKREDPENAVTWNKATMEFVSAETYQIPYFNGNIRNVPAVLLRQKATGRTAYFLNVHNPADVHGAAAKYRARAIAIERAKIIALRATGRPVFITGDFNDREKAFCPLTAGKLMISPNSLPSTSCAYPAQSSIDWIFAAGQARFSAFLRDKAPQTARFSDHPVVQATAHLQN